MKRKVSACQRKIFQYQNNYKTNFPASIQMEEPNRAATYNKYTDSVIHPIHMSNNNASPDRRHLEDLTNQQHSDQKADLFTVHHTQSSSRLSSGGEPKENMALVIDTETPTTVSVHFFLSLI